MKTSKPNYHNQSRTNNKHRELIRERGVTADGVVVGAAGDGAGEDRRSRAGERLGDGHANADSGSGPTV